jgi:integrase/recombinase XerC
VWNQFFTFLVADELAPGNPMGSVGRPKAPHRFPKPLRGEDTPERILASAAAPVDHTRRRTPWPERDFAVLAVLLCAGLRSTELLELTLSSVGGRRGERILTVRGKGGKERAVPVEPELEAVIDEYLESRAAKFGGRDPGRSDPLFVGRTVSGSGAAGCSTWSRARTGRPGSPGRCRAARRCTRCGTPSPRGWRRTGRARWRSCGCSGTRR